MIQATLFDLGNTLFKYLDFGLDAYAQRLQKAIGLIAHQLREASLLSNGHLDANALAEALFLDLMVVENNARSEMTEFDLSAELTRLLAQRLPQIDPDVWDGPIDAATFQVMADEFALKDDARSVLETLRAGRIRTALVSNTQFRSANHRANLAEFGILDLFDVLTFSIDHGVRKPQACLFRAALTPLGVPADRAVMIGDQIEADIDGARSLGMRTILIETPENRHLVASGEHQADAVVRELSEIPPLLADM